MNKSDSAYKTIGEVARILNLKSNDKGALPTHVIRFWETQFKQVKPKLLNSNRRYYDQKTINILKKIKFLLKDQGMTINGVKKILDNPFLKVQIEQIHLDHSGDAILVPKLGNHKIYFGNPADNVEDKLQRLQVFYEEGLPYVGWEKYKSISLAFDGQVVAKKR